MHPNFMHFCLKISFKNALEYFVSVSEHLRTYDNEAPQTTVFKNAVTFRHWCLTVFA